jgi:hypothetical protein
LPGFGAIGRANNNGLQNNETAAWMRFIGTRFGRHPMRLGQN